MSKIKSTATLLPTVLSPKIQVCTSQYRLCTKKNAANIEGLISLLDSGKDVSRRRLYRAIGSTALARMGRAWRLEVQSKGFKPPEIAEYARRLGIALRKYGKADFHSSRGSVKAARLMEVAESDFENALEYLIEVLYLHPDLRLWIDRNINFDDCEFGLHPVGMPYPIWSKSPYARKNHLPKRTIRDFKREALDEALERLEKHATRNSEPLPDLTMIVRSWRSNRLQCRDFSSLKF
jgi:hypothetical protein